MNELRSATLLRWEVTVGCCVCEKVAALSQRGSRDVRREAGAVDGENNRWWGLGVPNQ